LQPARHIPTKQSPGHNGQGADDIQKRIAPFFDEVLHKNLGPAGPAIDRWLDKKK
jgi:hypothetical protein